MKIQNVDEKLIVILFAIIFALVGQACYTVDRFEFDRDVKLIIEEIEIQSEIEYHIEDSTERQINKREEIDLWDYSVTQKEYDILCRIVEAESGIQSEHGKLLTANVILNRVMSKRFPNTIEKVVFQPRQFSPINDGRYYSVIVTSETESAVKRALSGEDYSRGALFFMARSASDESNVRWFDNSLEFLFEMEGHEFYAKKEDM